MLKLVCITLSISLLPWTALAQMRDQQGGAREYFTTNAGRRLTVRVQVWGEVPLSGIHHVPDNTNLLDLISYAGGPKGSLDDATIVLRRPQASESMTFTGEEFLQGDKARKVVVKAGDVVYVNIDRGDDFIENLTVVSTVTGVVSSLILTYLLVRDRL